MHCVEWNCRYFFFSFVVFFLCCLCYHIIWWIKMNIIAKCTHLPYDTLFVCLSVCPVAWPGFGGKKTMRSKEARVYNVVVWGQSPQRNSVSVVECQKGWAAEFKIFSSKSARRYCTLHSFLIIFSHSPPHKTYYYRYLIGTMHFCVRHTYK